jgi:hypothetical protein
MKKLFLILIASFTLNSNIYSQDINPSAPTTEEEYNYVTKGYKVQTESGLDMKKGYDFGEIAEETIGDYKFTVMCLIRVPKKEVAALLVKTKSANSGKTYYFCIPHDNLELSERYYQDLSGWDYNITKAYSYLISTKLSEIVALANEMEKKLKK